MNWKRSKRDRRKTKIVGGSQGRFLEQNRALALYSAAAEHGRLKMKENQESKGLDFHGFRNPI